MALSNMETHPPIQATLAWRSGCFSGLGLVVLDMQQHSKARTHARDTGEVMRGEGRWEAYKWV